MLQKLDQDRLDQVLKIIEKLKMRKPNATLMRGIPENKGNVSAYLNGTRPMSDNFYNTFMQKYGSKKSDEIAVLNAKTKVLAKELARLWEKVTGEPAKDYYLAIVEKMKAELIEQSIDF